MGGSGAQDRDTLLVFSLVETVFKAQAWVSAPGHRCGCGGEGAGTEPGSQDVRRRGSLTPESSQPAAEEMAEP